MSASDANVFPPKNAAYRLAVSFRKNDGTLITGWTGAASVVATDTSSASGGTPTEIGSTGLGYLDLTSGQMNGELIQVKCTVTNTDALPFVAAVYTGGVAEIDAATSSQAVAILAAIAALPTAAGTAAAVWGATKTQATDANPTTYGPMVDLLLKWQNNIMSVDGDVVALVADDNITPILEQTQARTVGGYNRGRAV